MSQYSLQLKPPSRFSLVTQRFIIKKVMQYLVQNSNEYWFKRLALFAKVTSIFYVIQGRVTRLKEPVCFQCSAKIVNKLSYLLHLELMHNDEISISRYEIADEKLTIHVQQKQSTPTQFLDQIEDNRIILLGSLENRYNKIIGRILKKFIKKQQKAKRVYYHSTDIFRVVGSESEDEDSQTDIGYIQRDLQKNRIAEFLDVNEKDKMLFQLWNDMMHEQKKRKKLVGYQEIKEVLMKFTEVAKQAGLKRANLLTHVWTLWSFGKICDQDILQCLNKFDFIDV